MTKKITSIAAVVALIFCFLTVSAEAANSVSNIDITVLLNNDGSANITQVWNGDYNEGTENYIPIQNLGEMRISDFSVSDKNGDYVFNENWDINADFNEKSGKCGIVQTDKGVELCFGISEYGSNTYTIRYVVNKLIGSYTDADGFIFQFVNSGMNTLPTDVTVKIASADKAYLNSSNSKIWAFGFNGQIEFRDNGIYAYTSSPLQNDEESVIIMTEFQKGLFSPERTENSSFEEVKEKAFDGSTYGSDNSGDIFIVVFIVFLIILAILAVIVAAIFAIRRKIAIKKLYKSAEYYRESPINGDLPAAYILGRSFDMAKESSIIGAVMLRMINKGYIIPKTEIKSGFLGFDNEEIDIHFVKRPTSDALEVELYDILLRAAGTDAILQEKELKKFTAKDPEKLRGFIYEAGNLGNSSVSDGGYFKSRGGRSVKNLTEQGKKSVIELMGLKKYLLEFSLIDEKTVFDSALWQDYMVYALLLGIADKVVSQLKNVYPDNIPELEHYERNVFLAYHYNTFMYSALISAEQARSAGRGGSASFGGGGGFSGGGVGGGSR